MNRRDQGPITWIQVNNIVPLITSTVLVVLSYAGLNKSIAVLENKVDMLISQNEKMLIKYSGIETRYGELSIKVAKLEAK